MSTYSAINLAELPPPEVIARLDFETIFAALKADLIARDPDLAPVLDLESEPATKVLQVWAYRELLVRAEFDDAGRGNMLAYAKGNNLDHLAAFYGVSRAIVQIADLSAVPPITEILEDDDRLRRRAQLALEGNTTAGSRGSYYFWGLSASAMVKDIGISSSAPGSVNVAVLSSTGDGSTDQPLLALVEEKLNADDVRPLTDTVVVAAAEIVNFSVEAVLKLYHGPAEALVLSAANAALQKYLEANHRLGHDITISGLHAALHCAGVQNVDLISPAADIIIGDAQAAFCSATAVTIGGRNV